MWDLVRIALEDIQNCFGITENLYEKYVEGEIKKDELLVPLIVRRQNNFDWKVETPLSGAGTSLNSCVLYSLIRYFDMDSVIETGVAGGFYTTFLLAGLCKNNYHGTLTSLEISDDKNEVGKLVPEQLRLPFDGAS